MNEIDLPDVGPQKGEERPDLRDRVTVFVSTVGAESYDECLARLQEQDCTFRLEIVDHVAPMSAALQVMLDRCTTPYHVQVDEDMLLFPHAVRTLHERIAGMEPNVAALVFPLYDVHLERCIHGLKIFRHSIVRRYPFRDVEGCEWEQVRRLARDGYAFVRMPLAGQTRTSPTTLGLHGTHWTPRSIYERFATLERKRRRGSEAHVWVRECSPALFARFLDRRSDLDFFAMLGVIAGALADHRGEGREKDYRTYDKLPGLESLRRFLDEVSGH